MATFHVQNLNASLVKFEANVNNYASIRRTSAPDMSRNIQSILSWVEGEKRNAKRQSKENKIAKIGSVIETCVDSLEGLSSGNPAQVMKGCLSIASSVAVVVGGPYGAAAVAICGILASILSASSPKEPDLVTVFTDIVHAELLKFNQELKRQTFEGLKSRIKNMNANLKELQRASNHIEIPDKVLYETDLPQFIGEVAYNFLKGLNEGSKEEEVNNSLTSMAIYCNAQTALFLLLTNILATFQSTGRETKMIKSLLDTQIQDAHEKLGFLSEEKYLRLSSVFTKATYNGEPPTEDDLRKVVTIRHFGKCSHLPAYDIIEGFREGLGMPRLQKTFVGLFGFCGPKVTIHRYPQPQTKGDNHYFQLINHSHVPVEVVCGTVGSQVNGLKFRQDVPPYSSYEHVATKSTWNFSTGGVFIMYLSGKKTSFEMGSDRRNLKVFEFALSNHS
ncbi:toxin CaTX-A-like [Orbicella faveolata]|uniref:toxin CaTX-A-like n=1 Tax=Orbicella faveolata TaxID=48498 RepID=UPI0009E3655E|nr:toxin CaTX-A-like [Orbicella faveolata]